MKRIVLVLASAALFSASAFGDEVELVAGEKLKGTIVSRDDRSAWREHEQRRQQ